MTGSVIVYRDRPLLDLLLSVSDRCNFHRVYSEAKEIFGLDLTFIEHDALMTFKEMTRLACVSKA